MPPTPTRSTGRGSGRQRQSSSLHPQTHPYKGARGPQLTDAPQAPFVHPALSQASGSTIEDASTALAAASVAQSKGRRPFNHKNLFARDLRNLMYAYGDTANPLPDSVSLMEEMMVDFITDLCCRARPSPYALGLGTSSISNSSSAFGATLEQYTGALDQNGEPSSYEEMAQTLPPRAPHRLRVKLEDFRHALRKDVEAKKLGRMEQLLYADKVVTEARRVGGVEEAAERAGALQSDNLPPPSAPNVPANGSLQSDSDDASDNELAEAPSGRKSGKGKGKGKAGTGGKVGRPKGTTTSAKKASAKAGSARSSVQP